ncbi:MAG: hypothetical protein JWO11_762 [Nocardioides sp.]|nr:hypothetical protein [Nocardioides sp.]
MTDQGGFQTDETAPIGATLPTATLPTGVVVSTANSPAPVAPSLAPPSAVPAVVSPAAPFLTTPSGWYPLNGEQRYWDGLKWTEHRAPAAVPVYRPAFEAPVVMTDARTNGAEVAIAWILTVLSVGYMLPWAIAATRGKSNSWAVGLVNVLLGWTFIGWIVALVMACTAHQVAFVQHRA